MFEVILYKGSDPIYFEKCDVGDLLPTIATVLQWYEREHGKYEYQRSYAIKFRQVKE